MVQSGCTVVYSVIAENKTHCSINIWNQSLLEVSLQLILLSARVLSAVDLRLLCLVCSLSHILKNRNQSFYDMFTGEFGFSAWILLFLHTSLVIILLAHKNRSAAIIMCGVADCAHCYPNLSSAKFLRTWMYINAVVHLVPISSIYIVGCTVFFLRYRRKSAACIPTESNIHFKRALELSNWIKPAKKTVC